MYYKNRHNSENIFNSVVLNFKLLYSVPLDKIFTDIISCHLNDIAELLSYYNRENTIRKHQWASDYWDLQPRDHSSENRETGTS